MGDGNGKDIQVTRHNAFLWKPWLIGGCDNKRSGKGIVRRLAVLLGSAALLLPPAEPLGQRTGAVARYLLAMAATAMATPAQAQTSCPMPNFGERRKIWTGIVTVMEWKFLDTIFGHGYSDINDVGNLNDKSFDIGVNSYTINFVLVYGDGTTTRDGDLNFRLTSRLTTEEEAALQLHVCDTTYDDFSGARDSSTNTNTYEWVVGLDWSSETTRTLHLSLPANHPATGTPTISGTAEFGEMLTAARSGITDADGLPTSFQYQWIRENQDGTDQEPIAGATSNTYTLALEDVGKKVRVQVSFTDQLSGMEEVTSAAYPATGTVTGPGVSVDATSLSADEGETLTYAVTLRNQPTGNVTITPTSDDSNAVSLSPASLTFSTSNWNTARTVSVTAMQDADGADETVTISHSVTGYGAVTVADAVTVTVDDDDVPGVSVTSPASSSLSEGETLSYTVELDTEPTGNVTITPESSDSGAVSVSPASLTFTTTNWNTARTVSVTAREDFDATHEMVSISHAVSGADYSSVTAASVDVIVTDNDTRGITLSEPALSLNVNEGSSGTYTLVLNTQPTGNVTITPESSDSGAVSVSPASLTFTTTNWNTARTVSVTAREDFDATHEMVSISHAVSGADYSSVTVAGAVTVTVTDDDTRGVTVSGAPLTINEDGTGFYRVVLTSQPTDDVTITPSLSGSPDVTFAPDTLTFTVVNWNAAQTVTVTAMGDTDNTDDTATITHTVAGADYGANSITAESVMVTVSEIVLPSVTIAADASPVSEGATAVFTLTRTDPTTEELVVGVSVTESGKVISEPAPISVTFLPGSATAPLSVPTDNDNVDEDAGTVTVMVAMDSANPATYLLGTPASASVTVNDDDSSPVVTLSLSENTITEAAGVSHVEAMLSRPSAVETRVTLSISDTVTGAVQLGAEPVLVIPAGMTASSNTVTLTAVDNEAEAPDLSVMVSGVAVNAVGVTDPEAVTLTITNDDDTTAPTVAITNVPATSAAPFTATITFNEVVSDFTVADITAVNATLSPLTETTPGTVWTVQVTPTATGEVTLTIPANVTEDTAGNDNLAAPPATSTYTPAPVDDEPSSPTPARDRTAPRVTSITRQDPGASPTNGDSLTWRVVFSETVTNVDAADFTVSGTTATVTNVAPVGDAPLAHDVTISGGDLASFNGTVTLGFASGQNIGDENGNALATTRPTQTNDNSYLADNTAPTVAITNVPARSAAPFTATITFNEVVSGFTAADITVSNATLSTFTEATTGEATPDTIWTVLVAPTADGRVTLTIPANVTEDAVGNGNTAALQARSIYTAPDTTAPTVGIDVPATSHAPFTATITFSEMVSGFTVDDITVSNATLSDFTEATTGEGTTGTVRTVLVTPEMDGPVTLDIAADVAMDAAGNSNTAATQARSTYTAPAMETEAKEEAEVVLKEEVLPEVIQQLTAQTTEVIASRLNSIASGSPSAPLTLSLDEVVADTVAFFHGEQEHLKNGSLEWGQVLSGRDFVLPLSSLNLAQGESTGAQDHPFSTLAIWGGGNYSSYRNIIERTDVDGNGFSGVIGMDLQPIPQLVSGLALTTSRWGLDYTTDANGAGEEGTYEIGVTMLNPYVNWWATEQLSLWATFGYGRGEVEQTPEGDDATTRTDALTSWAGGVRFEVVPAMDPLTGEGSPFGLAIKVDGATSSFLDTQVQLARLAAEVSHAFATEGGLLSAALELGWRIGSVSGNDDPDDQQQAVADQNSSGGTELAGHLNWRHTDGSVSATVDTRVLLDGGHHKEWGIGGHLRLTPSRRDGEGLSLTLQPSFGVTGTRLEELWSLSGDGDLAINNDRPNARLDAQLAYGFRPLGNALFTPYTELTWEETANAYGAGLRYHLNPSLELDLKGAHRRRANGNTEHRFSLDVRSNL